MENTWVSFTKCEKAFMEGTPYLLSLGSVSQNKVRSRKVFRFTCQSRECLEGTQLMSKVTSKLAYCSRVGEFSILDGITEFS